jgi:monomeric isocitrate dehydrogenase
MMDYQEFSCAGSSRVMPDEVFAGIFEKAGQEWRFDPTTKAKVVQYRRIGSEAWVYGGLRTHYRVQSDGTFCAKFAPAQKALRLCFLLEVE